MRSYPNLRYQPIGEDESNSEDEKSFTLTSISVDMTLQISSDFNDHHLSEDKKDHWPEKPLLRALQQIIFSYLMTPSLEYIEEATEVFGEDFLLPFQRAGDQKISPMLSNPFYNALYTTYHAPSFLDRLNFATMNLATSLPDDTRTVFGFILGLLQDKPVHLQLQFLQDAYRELFDPAPIVFNIPYDQQPELQLIKAKIVDLFTDQVFFENNPRLAFKRQLKKIIADKLEEFIRFNLANAFISTQPPLEDELKNEITNSAESEKKQDINGLIHQVQGRSSGIVRFAKWNGGISSLLMIVGILMISLDRPSVGFPPEKATRIYTGLGLSIAGTVGLFLTSFLLFIEFLRTERRVNFLNSTRQRFFTLAPATPSIEFEEVKEEKMVNNPNP